jgi:hypothetical protein
MTALNASTFPRDTTSNSYAGDREPIPRGDLPFGTLRWQATTGNRAQQGKISGKPTPNYFKIRMPTWAASTVATPLSSRERAAIDAMKAGP